MRTDHPQDDLLVVEFSHRAEADRPGRAARTWVLAKHIASQHGLEIEDALRQIDRIERTET